MAAAAWVFHQLRDASRQRATYRSLIYDFLGFAPTTGDRNQPDAYRLFMAAGALQLNNALAEAPEEELKAQSSYRRMTLRVKLERWPGLGRPAP
jgi:hypothetical protein